MITEEERLRFCIGRFDHYYDSVNNKCAVYLALGTFLVGGLVASYPQLVERFNFGYALYIVMGLILLCGLFSIIIVAWVCIPYLGKGNKSLLYFKSISEMGELNFWLPMEVPLVKTVIRCIYSIVRNNLF